MQVKIFSFLCPFALLFMAGCVSPTSSTQSVTKPAAQGSIKPASPAGNCATSASTNNRVLFGDHSGSDTTGATAGPGAGCSKQGLCEPVSVDQNSINVTFNYMQGTAGNPSIFTMMFPYATLFKSQQPVAIFFYNFTGQGTGPIATYPFVSNFLLSTLGNNFAQVCDQVSAGAAGAGTIAYNPAIDAANPPTNDQMNSMVIVTFTVTPAIN
jgi:hypothetical protein